MRCCVEPAAAVVLLPATAALADPSLAQIEAQIDQKNNDVEKVVEAFNLVNDQLAATQAQLDALKAKMAPLQASVDKAQGNVDQIAYTAYKGNSALGTMSVLLETGAPDTFMDQLTTLDQLSKIQQSGRRDVQRRQEGLDAEKTAARRPARRAKRTEDRPRDEAGEDRGRPQGRCKRSRPRPSPGRKAPGQQQGNGHEGPGGLRRSRRRGLATRSRSSATNTSTEPPAPARLTARG